MKSFEYAGLQAWWRILTVAMSFGLLAITANAAEQTLPVLETRTGTYTNVTVTTKAKSYVFILHQAGMANISIEDLSDEAKETLGYAVPAKKAANPKAVLARELVPKLESQVKPLQDKLENEMPWIREPKKIDRKILYIAGGILLLGYLFYSYCCHLICIKSKKPASVLVWLPYFRWIPMLRAADMSPWLILLMFFPLVPIWWCFKIAKAREMSWFVGLLLLLPITSIFAFLYLAFAPVAEEKEVKKFQSMALQTA